MSVLARWCHRHRLVTVLLWLGLLVGLGAASGAVGTKYSDSMAMPATESSRALELLKEQMPAAAGDTDTVVWHTATGTVNDPAVKERMTAALDTIAHSPSVASVSGPYTERGAQQISADGTTAYAQVVFTGDARAVPKADVQHVIDLAKQARTDGLDVQLGGQAVQNTETEMGGLSEIIGIVAALVVMTLVFRSAWAAALPILTAVAGVGTGVIGTGLLSHGMSIASVAPTLGVLVGLGVGIDYALFIVNRHRKGLMAGLSVQEASAKALNTSGRAVLFAGLTVVIALLGMLILGMGFLNGMAISAALTVALTVLAAITLLPALLGMLGLRVLSRAQRRRLAAQGPGEEHTTGFWPRWAARVQARPTGKALVALVLMLAVSLPVLSLRLGSSDAGNNPKTTTSRQAYDLMAKGFGPGSNGPLLLVAEAPGPADKAALTALVTELKGLDGVARVAAAPMQDGQRVGIVQVVPTTSPQSAKTSDLITELREHTVPDAEAGTGLRVHVGGATATAADFADVLIGKLPVFIAIIVGLGCLLMMVAFRSLLVPLIGVVMNLLTMGVAFGAIVAVFQWGWGSEALGAGAAGPVEAFAPVMIIAILFGLSMDYQVFLISRMHEEWTHTRDNHRAVRVGHGETGQVITAAAVIMACVFAAFLFGGQRMIAEFGLGLALAVLLDVLVLRMVLVPALMHRFGAANWWLPGWLDRLLPHVSVEGEPDPAPVREPELADARR
ncbi:MMPL family transporter [Kitasatospora sp. YST-16]|uniref:MMPL family transporter n=1 Tax=unclassified Kitasatospora TaxID=2633591 RepID=UPI0004C47263|nr:MULTISPECIES: MMPL family transporter [unclassified Kitasatospora]WAL74810.1 MMPL family transporter [Kitasatospora sp. YST-16]WNW40864.1 MMPL family transporter [Streptomyces sp. Li-HN-5-13]